MKTLLAALLFCLGFHATSRGTELSLAGGTDSTLTEPALADSSMASVSLLKTPESSAPATAWMGEGAARSLTLDAPKSTPAIATMNFGPSAGTGLSVPDSWIYGALATMLLALGWACSGFVSRPRAARLPVTGERRAGRTQRIHMLPLKP